MVAEERAVALTRAGLAAAFLAAAAVQAHSIAVVFGVLAHPEAAPVLPFEPPLFRPVVGRVGPEGVGAGLRDGDVLIQVAGVPVTGRGALSRALEGRSVGDVAQVVIARGRQPAEQRLEVPLVSRFARPLGAGHWAVALVLDAAIPVFCLLLGFGVAAVRPRDPLAWVLLWLMLGLSRIGDSGTATLLDLPVGPLISGYDSLFGQSWPLAMFLFGLLFPERLDFDRRHSWAKWLVIAPLGLLVLAQALRAGLAAESFARAFPLDRALLALGPGPQLVGMLAIGFFFSSIGFKWGTARSTDARRRLLLLLAGSALALTPPLLLLVAALVAGETGFAGYPPWAVAGVLLALGLFPLTLAYVIVVERAMDVRVVIRQGLQYAFARNGIIALRVVVSALLVLGAVTLAADPNRNRPRKILPLATGFMFVALVGRAADRLHAWTDRRFFREAYDAERVLADLGDRVRTIVERGPLLETVTRTISESLHVPRVAALLVGEDGLPGLDPASPVLERLRHHEAVRDRAALEPLSAELLLPLSVKDELLGALSLGPKLSEEPYSASDVRLLRSVAYQTSLALENSRLTEKVAAELARRERLNRELEIAREVQEQLFPQSYPKLPGLDLAGHCRPARGVGGDYYDFLSLADGRLGIAIGDISGKGIPAALLMAGLQASLRSQILAAPPDLTVMMGNLNRLICESSPSNRYATFFYGEYDPRTRRLVYVNAGHNAPMLFRRGAPAGEAIRLEAGGPVIGLLDPVPFQQGDVALEPGDVLVGFTDGVSEAMDTQGEEWGEESLARVVATADALPAEGLIRRIMEGADAFAAGAVQHDDMTLIVVRLVAVE
jgi:sigma-B regulation protein RsbU (phosphoserine phosphatase)